MPASSDPSMTVEAPAAMAFTMSPEYVMPPSAITGRSSCCARRVVNQMADSCGMPAPLTTRVVQIEPAPTPTFTASAPAAWSASTPSSVTTLPATTARFGQFDLIRSIAFTTPAEWPCAVSIAIASTAMALSASTRSSRSAPTPTAAAQRRRPAPSRVAFGEVLPLLDVLHRDEAAQEPVGVDERQLLDAVLLQHLLGLLERGAHLGGHEPVGRHELADRAVVVAGFAEPDVAVGEDADQAAGVVGDRHTAEPEAVHERLGVVERGAGVQRDRVGDHAALTALHLLHLGGLIGDRQVAVDGADAALAGDRDRHAGLGDLVHRC